MKFVDGNTICMLMVYNDRYDEIEDYMFHGDKE